LLHQHISLPQVPRLALMRTLVRSPDEDNVTTPHMCLLASALCNSAGASSARPRRVKYGRSRMPDRIRNCTTIASHISLPDNSSFADPKTRPRDFIRHLCTAVLTSIYCREYMFTPSQYSRSFRTFAEGDAYLEVALLAACGYTAEEVLHTMTRLVKERVLPLYRMDPWQGNSMNSIIHVWSTYFSAPHSAQCI
jgi:hypothetical protein